MQEGKGLQRHGSDSPKFATWITLNLTQSICIYISQHRNTAPDATKGKLVHCSWPISKSESASAQTAFFSLWLMQAQLWSSEDSEVILLKNQMCPGGFLMQPLSKKGTTHLCANSWVELGIPTLGMLWAQRIVDSVWYCGIRGST